MVGFRKPSGLPAIDTIAPPISSSVAFSPATNSSCIRPSLRAVVMVRRSYLMTVVTSLLNRANIRLRSRSQFDPIPIAEIVRRSSSESLSTVIARAASRDCRHPNHSAPARTAPRTPETSTRGSQLPVLLRRPPSPSSTSRTARMIAMAGA